jgi:hypothetical protein
LSRLRLGHALLEFIDSAGGIDELLLTRVEGMANVTDTDNNHGLGRTGCDDVAARATNFRFHILRMNIYFHKRLEKIALAERMTSPNLSFYFKDLIVFVGCRGKAASRLRFAAAAIASGQKRLDNFSFDIG